MKKALLLFVSVLLLFSLCACVGANEPYTVEVGWRDLTIDPAAGTISDRSDSYFYTIEKEGDSFTVTITYPDGSAYYEHCYDYTLDNTQRARSHSDNYDRNRYVPGEDLCKALEDEFPMPFFTGDPGRGFFKIVFGILHILFPNAFWWLLIGWLIKDAQPAKYTLVVFRVFGVLWVLSGIITCFVPSFGVLGIIFGLFTNYLP